MAFASEIALTNRSAAPSEVWIEPWGDFVLLEAGATLRVAAQAAEAGAFEVACGEGAGVTVWAWPSARVRCYVGAEELKADAFTQPVPATPPGMSTRAFLDLTLGRRGEEGPTR